MKKPAIVLAALFLFVSFVHAEEREDRFILESKEVKRVQGTLNYSTRHPQFRAEEWSVFLPVLPELSRQTKVHTTYSPEGKIQKEKDVEGRSYGWVKVVGKGERPSELKLKMTVEATLFERHLLSLPKDQKAPNVQNLSESLRKQYLAERGPIDFSTSEFQTWLKDEKFRREAKETDVAFARRVFLALRERGKYDFKAEMRREASTVCKSLESDCGGLSILFVSILRANQIPARTLCGRWAESSKPEEKLNGLAYFQTHVKAEFFAAGIGWIPVDMALAVSNNKEADKLRFFGHDAGDFIVFHVDPQFEVDTKLFGIKTLQWLQQPAWWVRGGGEVDPYTSSETWEVKVLK